MQKILKNKKAEGYIDIAVTVLVTVFLLVLMIGVWSCATLKQDMRYMCGELVETAAANGGVGEETDARYEELCRETGLTPEVSYTADYFDRITGKVQLGEVITCTLTCKMKLPGFGGFFLPFEVTVTQSGLSRVFWK